jgi:uncharacterized protein
VTARPVEGPLAWNVARLLTEQPGAERTYAVDDVTIDLGADLSLAEPIEGRARLIRTNRGILATADLYAALALQCSRCLRDVAHGVEIRFQEEYLPTLDLLSGRPFATDEPEVARLTDHHELDLETPVREALQLAEPIAVLCRPDCPGLCTVCGGRLDEGEHEHATDDIDPRLEALRAFRTDDS